MASLILGNQKHLTLDNRVFIEKCLDQDMAMILMNHPEFGISEKTIYNYIERGLLELSYFIICKRIISAISSCFSFKKKCPPAKL